jgi:DNA-binding NtrC family response regulator
MPSTVLLLEDDPYCLRVLEAALIAGGYDVIVCDSPEHVAGLAKTHPGALALVDFWGRSQLALTPQDRRALMQLTAIVPTVLVSGRHWAEYCVPEDLGLLDVVVKPFSLWDFYEVIERCAAHARDFATAAETPPACQASHSVRPLGAVSEGKP